VKDTHVDREQIVSRALASLREEGAAQPSSDLALRAASRALGATAPSAFDELLAAVVALVRPAAALGCAAALVLGVAHASTRTTEAVADVASRGTLELWGAQDALEAVLPFSVNATTGGAG
jgi:hypothetical protein